jgi:membrane protein DedA with SNARE-associated domain
MWLTDRGRTSIDEHVECAELIHHLAPLISVYGSWLVAAIIALECVGVPLPGETVLIAAALYAGSTHELSIWSVFVAGVLGGVIGNFIAFWVGREFGYRLLLRYGRYVHLSESRIKIGQYLFLRHGSKVVFFARFVPLLRSVVGFLAGANYMPWRDFWIANIAGAIAWVAIDAFGAYYLGAEIKRLAAPAGVAIGIMVLAIIVFIAVVLARHEKRLEVEAERAFPGPLRPVRTRRRK